MKTSQYGQSKTTLAIAVEGALAALALFLAWIFGVPLRTQFAQSTAKFGWAVAQGVVATLPLLAIFWWLVHANWPEARRLRQQVERLISELFPRASLVELAAVAAVAGVSEELLFRGVAQSLLARWSTPMIALIVASLIFGLFHAVSLLYFVVATLAGAYFGWLMVTFGDLVAPIVAHAFYDFIALAYLTRQLNARVSTRLKMQRQVPWRPIMNGLAIKTITCQQLHELSRAKQVALIDVRTLEEFQARRATGARNVPLDSPALQELLHGPASAADEPIYFICEVGGRSGWACAAFMAAGHSNVINVEGGTQAWAEAGLPITSGP
jgi:hypothetical protein